MRDRKMIGCLSSAASLTEWLTPRSPFICAATPSTLTFRSPYARRRLALIAAVELFADNALLFSMLELVTALLLAALQSLPRTSTHAPARSVPAPDALGYLEHMCAILLTTASSVFGLPVSETTRRLCIVFVILLLPRLRSQSLSLPCHSELYCSVYFSSNKYMALGLSAPHKSLLSI